MYRVAPKSKPLTFVQVLTDLQNFLTGTFCGKFVIKWLLNNTTTP